MSDQGKTGYKARHVPSMSMCRTFIAKVLVELALEKGVKGGREQRECIKKFRPTWLVYRTRKFYQKP